MIKLLETCGRHGKWVLPVGLVAGVSLPWAAGPVATAIPFCIAVLLFLSVLRLLTVSHAPGKNASHTVFKVSLSNFDVLASAALLLRVLIAQLLLPLCLFFLAAYIGLAWQWCLALTLVAAASPISGSPNLVQLLRGDDHLTLRWLVVGTALLPITCLPVMQLLYPSQSPWLLLKPSLNLLALIGSAVLLAYVTAAVCSKVRISLSSKALDGAGSLMLALLVIGLMSALHQPDISVNDLLLTLGVAIAINGGLQLLGVLGARLLGQGKDRLIATGVVYGNRNIALYLAALPAAMMEPLLLFIACYQIPMYLTPLLGGLLYRRVAG